jgi:hypothetical protein
MPDNSTSHIFFVLSKPGKWHNISLL